MKNRFFNSIFIQSVGTCLGFLFSQPQTYIMIILRTVKGDTSCTSIEQSFVHANCDQRYNLSQFIHLLKKLLCLYTVGFFDQGASRSSSCDELKNFAANILLQLVIEVTYQDLCNWLVTCWEQCIERRDCHYRTSLIRYWGKGSIVDWYKVLGFLYL